MDFDVSQPSVRLSERDRHDHGAHVAEIVLEIGDEAEKFFYDLLATCASASSHLGLSLG